jgi:hypothetical protein
MQQVWMNATPETMSNNQRDTTLSQETAHQHAIEERDKTLITMQDLEMQLGIMECWLPGSTEWQKAADLVARRTYQRCLDNLEGLVVARMFELTKMNQSQTGTHPNRGCFSC